MSDIPIAELEVFCGAAFAELKALPEKLSPDDAVLRAELVAAIDNVIRIVLAILLARLGRAMLDEAGTDTAH
jgi:hypothetical protein